MGSSFNRDAGARDTVQMVAGEQAIERYRYMLRTAPPEAIEQAHAEAFAQLTPGQRRLVFEQLGRVARPEERPYLNEDPRSLARIATRTEMRCPGMLEQLFGSVRGDRGHGGYGGGLGTGGMIAGSLLGSVAGNFLGSAVALSFFDRQPFDAVRDDFSTPEKQGFGGGSAGHELAPETVDVAPRRRIR